MFGIAFDISRMPAELKKYWLHGAGAAEVGWGTPGSFARCVKLVNEKIVEHGRKPLPDREVKGLCANLHREATGATPGNAPGEHHHAIEDPTARMAGLIAEFAGRHVRNADYWHLPVGTPITPGMKPSRARPKRDASGHPSGGRPAPLGYRPAKHLGIAGWENAPTTPARPNDDRYVMANIIRLQGWDRPMTELDDKEFDEFAATSPAVVYRGVEPAGDITASELNRKFLDEDDPYIGDGNAGAGRYTSERLGTANSYTIPDDRPTPKRIDEGRSLVGDAVLEMAFHPGARILDLTTDDTKNGDRRDDHGEYAAQLGYDAVKIPGVILGEKYYVLLNRSAVVVRRMRQ